MQLMITCKISSFNKITHAAGIKVIDAETGEIIDDYWRDSSGMSEHAAYYESLYRAIDRCSRKYNHPEEINVVLREEADADDFMCTWRELSVG